MAKTDYFWTDMNQAQDRLMETVVLYDNEPVFIHRIEPHDDGDTRARLSFCNRPGDEHRKKLNSPKFEKFRKLPPLGFVNRRGGGEVVYLTRKTVASRQHGLNNQNVVCFHVAVEGDRNFVENSPFTIGKFSFSQIWSDQGFTDCVKNSYPSLSLILLNIAEGSCIAYSRDYAVYRSIDGIRWLFRGTTRIGLFSGSDTLLLLSKMAYLREEIMQDEAFTLNNIREF